MPIPPLDIPPGRWALAASAGADSTALLLLALRNAPAAGLHLLHLNHQTRGNASDADAAFVTDLAARHHLPVTTATLAEIESLHPPTTTNPSARYRAARLAFFADACREHHLAGVLLAHHADDQAETVLQRLLRGSGPLGLTGMSPDSTLATGLRILRPVLTIPRVDLRDVLTSAQHPWRDDASNESDAYARNRVRKVLAAHPTLGPTLVALGSSMRELAAWARATAPVLPESFPSRQLAALPEVLADVSARAWLAGRGVPPSDIDPPVVARLLTLARDAASPASINLPARLTARRRRGLISAEPNSP